MLFTTNWLPRQPIDLYCTEHYTVHGTVQWTVHGTVHCTAYCTPHNADALSLIIYRSALPKANFHPQTVQYSEQ